MSKTLKLALLQLKTSPVKRENFLHAERLLRQTVDEHGPVDMVMLPECFNCPYSIKLFRKYCESIPDGETTRFLSQFASDNKVTLVGGSYPEVDGSTDSIYNTSVVFSPEGTIVAKYRKTHLFDVDIPGKISFQESRILGAGDHNTVFQTKWGNVGLAICYDLRFPEVANVATRPPYSSFMMMYPGAFNTTTGPKHWELLARARAVDNQCFVAVCSSARDLDAKYHAYGHSLVVDPWGKVIARAHEEEEAVVVEIDTSMVDSVRQSIPTQTQRRFDLYGNSSTGAVVKDK